MKTVRDLIKDIQGEVRSTELHPERASELLNQLSSLLGNVNDQLKDKQMDYNKALLVIIEDSKTVAKARLVGETTQEYEELLSIKGTKELVLEMIRSLKYYLKSKYDEQREVKY